MAECLDCHGTSKIIRPTFEPCPKCRGTGSYRFYGSEPLVRTVAVIAKQVGEIATCTLRHDQEPEGYRAYMKSSVADIIAQMEFLCEAMKFSFVECRALGRERFKGPLAE